MVVVVSARAVEQRKGARAVANKGEREVGTWYQGASVLTCWERAKVSLGARGPNAARPALPTMPTRGRAGNAPAGRRGDLPCLTEVSNPVSNLGHMA